MNPNARQEGAWILLRILETDGERTREVYIGPGVVLTGSARLLQEAEEEAVRKLLLRAEAEESAVSQARRQSDLPCPTATRGS